MEILRVLGLAAVVLAAYLYIRWRFRPKRKVPNPVYRKPFWWGRRKAKKHSAAVPPGGP